MPWSAVLWILFFSSWYFSVVRLTSCEIAALISDIEALLTSHKQRWVSCLKDKSELGRLRQQHWRMTSLWRCFNAPSVTRAVPSLHWSRVTEPIHGSQATVCCKTFAVAFWTTIDLIFLWQSVFQKCESYSFWRTTTLSFHKDQWSISLLKYVQLKRTFNLSRSERNSNTWIQISSGKVSWILDIFSFDKRRNVNCTRITSFLYSTHLVFSPKFIFSTQVGHANCSDSCASRSFESNLFNESIEPVHKTVLKDSFALKHVGRIIVIRSRHVYIRIMIKEVSSNFSSMCIFTYFFF